MSEWREEYLTNFSILNYGDNLPINELKESGYKVFGANGFIGYFNKFNLFKDTVLISCRGEYSGKINIVPAFTFVTNNSIPIILTTDEIETFFLFYQLQTIPKHKILSGSAQPQVTINDLKKIKIKLPSLPTQRKIAKILSTVDNVIEKTQAAIEKYKAIKQGMLKDLFTRGIDIKTGKLRPKYEDAPELYKTSPLGFIPKEWEVEKLENITHLIISNVDKYIREDEKKVFLCNYMDVYTKRYLTNNNNFSIGSVNNNELEKFILKIQDVIITKDSETPDEIAVPSVLIEEIPNLVCGYHLCILRSKNLNLLNGEFLMLQLQIHDINRQFAIRANGSTRYGLTISSIEECRAKVPKDIVEQLEIVKRLKSIDTKIQSEEKYLQKLQQLKLGLMNDLLTGKKEVKAEEEN